MKAKKNNNHGNKPKKSESPWKDVKAWSDAIYMIANNLIR